MLTVKLQQIWCLITFQANCMIFKILCNANSGKHSILEINFVIEVALESDESDHKILSAA